MTGSNLASPLFEGFERLKAYWWLLFPAYVLGRIAWNAFFHPLAKYPGPWLAKISDAWKAGAVARLTYRRELSALHKRYGDVVRISPNEVSIIAPNQVYEVYGHNSQYLKGPFVDAFPESGKSHFSNRNPVTHALRRRAVAPAYAVNHILSLERFCDPYVDMLFGRLDAAADTSSVVDVAELLKWFAYDAICSVSFGCDYGLLKNGVDKLGILTNFALATHLTSIAGCLISIGWILPTKFASLVLGLFAGDQDQAIFVKTADQFVRKREAIRAQDSELYEERKDMLYRFLEARDPSSGEPFTHEDVVREGEVIVSAGADTTRIGMTAFLRYIYDSPHALAKIRAEIDDAVSKGQFDATPKHSQVARLEYLQAALKEAMRLHPAGGMTFQRVVPEGGRVIGGNYYPAGCLVGMCPWNIHYDERAFGKDAAEFRPERWLGKDRSDLEKYNLSFGQGSRACLGKNLALVVMLKVLSAIVYKYDIKFAPSESASIEPYKTEEHLLTPQRDFHCIVAHRPL